MKHILSISIVILMFLSSSPSAQTMAGFYGSFGGFLYHSDNDLPITELDNFLHDYGGGAFYQRHWKNTRSLRLNFEYDNSGQLIVGSNRQTDVNGNVIDENAIKLRQQVFALDFTTVTHYGSLAVGGGLAMANVVRTIRLPETTTFTVDFKDQLNSIALGPVVYVQAVLPLNADRSMSLIPGVKMRYLYSVWHYARGRQLDDFRQHFATATAQIALQVQL